MEGASVGLGDIVGDCVTGASVVGGPSVGDCHNGNIEILEQNLETPQHMLSGKKHEFPLPGLDLLVYV